MNYQEETSLSRKVRVMSMRKKEASFPISSSSILIKAGGLQLETVQISCLPGSRDSKKLSFGVSAEIYPEYVCFALEITRGGEGF